jgi:S-adenosylmethionine:tRNA ribosyltransferase-isomerase
MNVGDFDFDLPAAQIAQYPLPVRDHSRLLVVDRRTGAIAHRRFDAVPEYLEPADALVVNRTRVLRARLRGRSHPDGGQVELLLVRQEGDCWLALGKPGRRLQPGAAIEFGGGDLRAVVVDRAASGVVRVRFDGEPAAAALTRHGQVPLPPYIRRASEPLDDQRYQTVYAQEAGAVAAPTAGLHFTAELLARIAAQGTAVVRALLHVGPGTFAPVRCDDPREHVLDPEYCALDAAGAQAIRAARERGGKITAVGTTVVRTLETAAEATGQVEPWAGESAKFIYPPYRFAAVDALITNFHLPRSSLLLLVAAFAGRELVLHAYAEAVRAGYRFYSYGDAMLIL